ncbi:hypothetical protein CDL12_04131 [Handroanthus impetiginosus]|uniref:Uncharacterized protein n=1 Tax=Handroanthus impetiginosus TaxID=429701 RepID=A0A2G9I062_9LAMI|nr:hypothetical protein CDL12_04131 [Handroanthus impetiginosus]
MPPLSDKELEERLSAVGNSLLQPPSSLDELLPLLDQIEELLSKVEQSPAKSMQTALSPLMKAVVAEELVKHSDADVKVGVASCISEITRITAPDAPYDDDKMKDIFQLIVSSFENLSDISSRSHEKRATILETVAKVRSCVIMLDLECDQLIIEMFQHFLKAIRAYHSEVIFASMETIMTLVLEESEDISLDLLSPILATLKRDNEDVMPIAKKLAERVIQNSAEKLRPYLIQAVRSLDASFDDYSEVVASVCHENIDAVGNSNESILKDQPVAKDGGDASIQDKDPTVTRSPKSIVSNGINETGTEETITDTNSSKKADPNQQLDAKSMSKIEPDAQKPEKLEAKVEHEETQQVPYNPGIASEDVQTSPSKVKPVEGAKTLDKVEDAAIQLSPSKAPENEAVDAASPTQSGSLPDKSQSEKDSLAKRKENLVKEEVVPVDTAAVEASEGEHISEAKKQQCPGKKRPDETTDKNKGLAEAGASKNDDGSTSDLQARSLDQTEKLGNASDKMEDGSSLRKKDGKKSGRVKPTIEKDAGKSSARAGHGKDTVTSPRSPLKSTKDEAIKEETPRMSTKRKRTPSTEKASETLEYGENLVGSKVKVWWPKDRMFYEGVIASFDSVKKKHKVLYIDGDKEILNLRRERWEFIGDDLVSDEDQDVGHSSHDASSDMQRKKKGNKNAETSSKRRKMESSPKSKLKDTATKSGGKSKDDGKAESEAKDHKSKPSRKSVDDNIKSKDHSQKLGGKSQSDSGKAAGRSKDNVAKTPSNSKQDSQRAAKSKGKTPPSGKSLSASGTKMMKSSTPKVKETDRMKEKLAETAKSSESAKGKSTETAKSRESETKSGKKRRR